MKNWIQDANYIVFDDDSNEAYIFVTLDGAKKTAKEWMSEDNNVKKVCIAEVTKKKAYNLKLVEVKK